MSGRGNRAELVKSRVGLAATIGRVVKLRKAGREMVGLCPFHSETTPSFTVNEAKGFYHCFGCAAHGDVIGFIMQLRGCDFLTALAELEQGLGELPAGVQPAPRKTREERASSLLSSTEAGQIVWGEARPCAAFDLPARYLRGRGIDVGKSGILDVVRFHAECPVSPWRRDSAQRGLCAPALISPAGKVIGDPGARLFEMQAVHITFLAADGNGKAKLPDWVDRDGEVRTRASRVMWGETGRCAVPIPPVGGRGLRDLSWIDEAGELVVAEGLESTLSLMGRHWASRGGFATLSLNNLQGYWLNDGPGGSLRLWQVTPDPDRPGFRIGRVRGPVVIGIDADMKGLKNRLVQDRVRERAVRRDLTGAERSEICAQLARGHWLAGFSGPVKIVRPPQGKDFNDIAMEERA